MTSKILLVAVIGLLYATVVSSQGSSPTWVAAMGGGMGVPDPADPVDPGEMPRRTSGRRGVAGRRRMVTPPWEPNDFQTNDVVMQINRATTVNAAATAAATIYRPYLDPPDVVVNALEEKVARLQAPPGWNSPRLPPLPFGFDALRLIMSTWKANPVTTPPDPHTFARPPTFGAPQPGAPQPQQWRPRPVQQVRRQRRPPPPPPPPTGPAYMTLIVRRGGTTGASGNHVQELFFRWLRGMMSNSNSRAMLG